MSRITVLFCCMLVIIGCQAASVKKNTNSEPVSYTYDEINYTIPEERSVKKAKTHEELLPSTLLSDADF